jgi:bZIP-type transcription factor MBZ1
VALRQEVDALKRAMLEGRANPVLPPPAPLTTTPAATNAKRSTRTLNKPNTKKDLPTSPRATPARAFWGGSNSAFAGAGGITPVHATLVPDFPAFTEKQDQQDQQENINPALNLPCFGGVGTTTPNPKFPLSPFQQPNLGSNFDAFADLNPFTLKTLDAYRMQLWGRMAREAGAQQAQQRQRAQSPVQSQLTSALRPAFFTAPSKERDTARHSSPTLSALLSGKTPAVPASSPSSPRAAEIQPQHAMLASLASQTLLSKMGSAFWDAFAGPGTATAASPAAAATGRGAKADWDHEKVRKVLEGKAVVRVVDVDTPTPGASPDALEESMRSLSLAGHSDSPSACAGLFLRTRAAVVGKK